MESGDIHSDENSEWTEYGDDVEVKKEVEEEPQQNMEEDELDLEKCEEFDIVSIEEVTIDVLATRMRRIITEVIKRGINVASQLFDVSAKLIFRSSMLDESETNPVTSMILRGTKMIILSIDERDEECGVAEKNILMFVTKLSVFSKSQKYDGLLRQLIVFIDKFFYHPESKIRCRIYNLIGMLLVEMNNIVEVENEEADNEFMFGDDMSQGSQKNEKIIEDAIIDRWAQKLSMSVLDKSPLVRAMAVFALSQVDHQKIINDKNGNERCVNDIIARSLSDIDETVRRTAVKCIHIVKPSDIDKCFNLIERSTENKIRHLMAVRLASSIHLLSFSEVQRFRFINILRKSESVRMQDVVHQHLVESWLRDASETISELSIFATSEIDEEDRFDPSEVIFPSIILEYLNPMEDREATSLFLKFAITRYVRNTTGKLTNIIDFEAFLKLLTEYGPRKCDKIGIMTRSVFRLVPDNELEDQYDDNKMVTQSYYRIFILRNLLDVIFQLTNDVAIRDRTLRFLVLGISPFVKHVEEFCEVYFVNMDLVGEKGDTMEALIVDILHIFDVIIQENNDQFEITMYRNLLETMLSNAKFIFSPELVAILTTKLVDLSEDIGMACEWICYTANSIIMMDENGIPVGDDLQIALTSDILMESMLRRGTAMLLSLCKHPMITKCTLLMSSVFTVLLPSLLSNKNEDIKFDGIELIGHSTVIDFENAIPYLRLCPLLMIKSTIDREKAVYLHALTQIVRKRGYQKVAEAIFGPEKEKFERILMEEYLKIETGTIEKCQATRDLLSMLTSEPFFWPQMLANIMKVIFDPKMKQFKLIRFFDKYLQCSVKSLKNRIHLMRAYLLCAEQFDEDFSLDLMAQKVFQHFNNYAEVEIENIDSANAEFSIENELCRRLVRKSISQPRSSFVKQVFSDFSVHLNIDFIPLRMLKEIRDLASRAAHEAEEHHIRPSVLAIKRFITKCDKTISIKKRIERMRNGGKESDTEEPCLKRARYEKDIKEESEDDEIQIIDSSDEKQSNDEDDDFIEYVPRPSRSRKRKMIDEDEIKEEIEDMEY